MKLPRPCGPVSKYVVESLTAGTRSSAWVAMDDKPVTTDRDVQLALWVLYELAYRGFDDVDDGCEWDLDVIRLRREIERRFENELRRDTKVRLDTVPPTEDVAEAIFSLAASDGPPLASYLRRDATIDEMREFLTERSLQQLKEADPQSFLLPRLQGDAKVALAELQYDEYGSGRPGSLHQALYARTLQAAGLDPGYGAYVDVVSAESLAAANVMSMFAFNRRLAAAGAGHFAAFEATSSVPSRRIATGLERLGLAAAAAYFHEHVEADAVHEQVAARGMCGALVRDRPETQGDVLFGAACALHLEALAGDELLHRWGSARQEAAS